MTIKCLAVLSHNGHVDVDRMKSRNNNKMMRNITKIILNAIIDFSVYKYIIYRYLLITRYDISKKSTLPIIIRDSVKNDHYIFIIQNETETILIKVFKFK